MWGIPDLNELGSENTDSFFYQAIDHAMTALCEHSTSLESQGCGKVSI